MFITFITPTYNRKGLLEKAILSVVHQKSNTPYEWEMIIIDDGSSDGTESHIEAYLEQYPKNIFYHHIQNVGMNNARNYGFERMNKESDYIIFLDSDDEMKEDCIYRCLQEFDKLRKRGVYEKILGLFFFAEDECGNLIGNKDFLQGKDSFIMNYEAFLRGTIGFEPGFIFKSDFFLEKTNRFDADVPSGGTNILWSKWWEKAMGEEGKYIYFFDYIGRVYRQNVAGRLTHEYKINKKRFLENALSGERSLAILGEDYERYGLEKNYAHALFRAGVNFLLSGERDKGIGMIKKSLGKNFSLLHLSILILGLISTKSIGVLYELYTYLEYRLIKK